MDLNTIFFIGPQGSGKGTQAKLLAERLNFFHWDMGSILRETANQETELGKKVKTLIDNGVLLQDELLLQVASSKINTIAPETGVVFDGIPRRIGQAEFLIPFLKKQGRTNFVVLHVNIPEPETMKRLLLRAQKEGRADDNESAIKFRLEQYHKDTLPVLDFLKANSQYFEIDGTPSIEKVTANINQTLGLE